jgi:drug/metabolite transporter (DMT)-like permease
MPSKPPSRAKAGAASSAGPARNSLSSPGAAIGLFAFVIVAWGLNWVLMKVIVEQVTPLWAVAIRTAAAAVVLVPIQLATRQLVIPQRSDLPVVLAISLFHMAAFAALMAAGLKYVPVGRSVVLGYTTPLWVAPAAWLLLDEPMPPRRVLGVIVGLAGLLFLFNPLSFDWSDGNAVLGNGLVLLAALAWSISILYTRAHRWTATPFQLVMWQAALAAGVLSVLAIVFEGAPHIAWNAGLIGAFACNGVIGTAFGFWAMTVVNKELPATTTSLGLLGTPVAGIALSALFLGERIDSGLMIATAMILLGIAIGTAAGIRR